MRLEWEVVKWIAILTLAGALAWLLMMQTAAAAPVTPRLLPDDAARLALPMTPVDPNVLLTKVVAAHQAGEPDRALELWREVQLPEQTEVWRQIGMGVAQLQMGDLDAAGAHLMKAEDAAPQNPIVHYYLGLLRLDQARQAHEWYDAVGPQTVRLVAYRPHLVAPNTRGMYELVAMQEFEQAIENAGMFDRTIVLALPDYRVTETVAVVTTGDLVTALGCEKFEGQAHNILGAMFLDRGNAELAEEHMDAATEAGLDVVFGYRDLGATYERTGRHADAARAYLKALKEEPGKIYPLQKLLENAGKTLFE
jgi:tetratricopeptide (TPR) repeat protein